MSARPSSIATSPFSGQSSLSRQSSQHAADADYVPPSRTASSAPATRSSKQSSSHSRASLASGRSTAASSRPRSGDGRASSLQHSPPGSVRDGTPGSETSAKDLGEELSDADSKGSARSATSSRVSHCYGWLFMIHSALNFCACHIPRLHEQANIKQTSNKHQVCMKRSLHEANMKQTSIKHRAIRAHVVPVYFDVCLMFAWSCKRGNTVLVWRTGT